LWLDYAPRLCDGGRGFLPLLGPPKLVALSFSEKLQNVMAITDVLALFWQSQHG
jgi:hypothetical protein